MKISLQFSLAGAAASSAGSAVRAWIDVDKSGQLTQNEELDLTQNNTTWSGSIKSMKQNSGGMGFIVKYLAAPGAEWALEIKSDTPTDHVVFSDKNTVPSLQAHVIGTLDP